MTPVRLAAIDVDGTLLTTDLRLTERTRSAVEAVRRAGIEVALATARAPVEVESLLRALPGVELVIALQGAWVGWWSDPPRAIAERMVPLEAALEVTSAAVDVGLSVGWFGPFSWEAVAVDAALRRHATVTGVEPDVVLDLAATRRPPHKVMLMAREPVLEQELDTLAARVPAGCSTHRSHGDYLEVVAAGVDKGTGLAALVERLGIGREAIVAIGDGDNDVGLLRTAGHGMAVANGTPAALAAASEVTASNDEDGVAIVLERLAVTGR